MSRSTLTRALAVVGAAIILSFTAVPSSASAAAATSISFVSADATTAAFDSDWVIALTVAREAPTGPVQPGEGTVDVYLDGIAGIYAAGLPIQAGGTVYFAQPTGQPLLAAGTYSVRAIFNPQGGSDLTTSQTAKPVDLTISPLALTATVSAVMDASVSEQPTITAALSGAAVDAFGGAPAGTWSFTVTGPDSEAVFTREVAQQQGSTSPVVLSMDAELAHGTEYALASSFAPHPSLAGGLVVEGPAQTSFVSASATLTERLVAPVPVEWWMVGAAGVLLFVLVAVTIWLGVLTSRRRPSAAAEAEGGDRLPSGADAPDAPDARAADSLVGAERAMHQD